MKKKITVVVGARPQYIKHAFIYRKLSKKHDVTLIDTGQHYDKCLSGIFFDGLNIPKPDVSLQIGSGSHGTQTACAIKAIESHLLHSNPDQLLVYGDTNSSLAGALAASKLNIPIIHIESGLRSFDMSMPEEINRTIIDRISSQLYAPTETAIDNLLREGMQLKNIHKYDVVQQSLLYNIDKATARPNIYGYIMPYFVATIHRKSNIIDKFVMLSIFKALKDSKLNILLPLHPGTKKVLVNYGIYDYVDSIPNIKIIEPVGYLDMLNIVYNSSGVITDSGGLQHEADILHVPCVTLRNNTEWVESTSRKNILVGNDYKKIIDGIKSMFGGKFEQIARG